MVYKVKDDEFEDAWSDDIMDCIEEFGHIWHRSSGFHSGHFHGFVHATVQSFIFGFIDDFYATAFDPIYDDEEE